MTEKVLLGGLGSTAATVEVVTYEAVGGITHLRGLSLSPLNELSDELSCGLMWRVQAEISE